MNVMSRFQRKRIQMQVLLQSFPYYVLYNTLLIHIFSKGKLHYNSCAEIKAIY